LWIEARQRQPKEAFDRGYCLSILGDNFGSGLSSFFPLYVRESKDLFAKKSAPRLPSPSGAVPNLTEEAGEYVAKQPADPMALIHHILAVLQTPMYRHENSGALRQDWPRIPLPDTRKALEASAALGRQLAALLDTEADVSGVTSGDLEPICRSIGVLTKVGHVAQPPPAGLSATGEGACATQATQLDPDAGDLAVTAGWGHAGKEGITMPAKGRIVQRPYDKAELEALRNAANARGLSLSKVIGLLGSETCDMYLNDKAYWKNIPRNVWDYYIGGYQVIKKWLSYREQELLGRPLRADEAREVTGMARRLARIVLLQPTLDANYRLVKTHAYAWSPTNQALETKGRSHVA
jgi:hypothetical protein